MGQIIIDIPGRGVERRYKINDVQTAAEVLAVLKTKAQPVKVNPDAGGRRTASAAAAPARGARLSAQDKTDIADARKAKKEYLRTGESYSVDELRAEFNL